MKDFIYGIKKGFPIFLGYLTVSFAFGVFAINGGITPLVTIFMSLTNLTSAGQFAGVKLIINLASFFELGLTVFLINLRYSLMSISLSQKIDSKVTSWQRLVFGFGITDEIFVVASQEKTKLTFKYMLGLISLPIIGWTLGTALGVYSSNILSENLRNAMGIALYAMFIAIFIPEAKKSKSIFIVVIIAIFISCIFYYFPYFDNISLGIKIIASTIIAALLGAFFFPIKEGETNVSNN